MHHIFGGKRSRRAFPSSIFLLLGALGVLLYLNYGYLKEKGAEVSPSAADGSHEEADTPAVAAMEEEEEDGSPDTEAQREELNLLREQLKDIEAERDEVSSAQKQTEAALQDVKKSVEGAKAKIEAVQKQIEIANSAARSAQLLKPAPAAAVVDASDSAPSTDGINFDRTAVVTMAAGNTAARGVVALVQSLRDTNTRAQDIVVMLSRGGQGSPECRDGAWKAMMKRSHVNCAGPDTIPEEIISPKYCDALRRMGAILMPIDEIPSTPYTAHIPGGRSTFWGMALNKLRVFHLTQYRKVLWMDGDTLVLKNVDHLFAAPMLTAAMTYGERGHAAAAQDKPATELVLVHIPM